MTDDNAPKTTARCPTCGKPAVFAHRPFCSRRCADVDLARWLGGGYVIPGADRDIADDSTIPDRAPDRAADGRREPEDDA